MHLACKRQTDWHGFPGASSRKYYGFWAEVSAYTLQKGGLVPIKIRKK